MEVARLFDSAAAALVLLLAGCTVSLDPLPTDGSPTLVEWQPLDDSVAGFGVTGRRVALQTGALAIDREGRVYAGWADPSSGQNQVYLRMWDGQTWQGVGGSESGGGISQTGGDSRLGDIGFDSEQRPVIVWLEVRQGLFVVRWDGRAWQPIGDSSSATGLAGQYTPWWPSMRIILSSR
jgi:hypothetical protein